MKPKGPRMMSAAKHEKLMHEMSNELVRRANIINKQTKEYELLADQVQKLVTAAEQNNEYIKRLQSIDESQRCVIEALCKRVDKDVLMQLSVTGEIK